MMKPELTAQKASKGDKRLTSKQTEEPAGWTDENKTSGRKAGSNRKRNRENMHQVLEKLPENTERRKYPRCSKLELGH